MTREPDWTRGSGEFDEPGESRPGESHAGAPDPGESDPMGRMERGVPSSADPGEDAEARRLAALYGLGEPPEDDGGRNPFWWIWAFLVPFMLLAMGLMAWRLVSTPSRSIPGL